MLSPQSIHKADETFDVDDEVLVVAPGRYIRHYGMVVVVAFPWPHSYKPEYLVSITDGPDMWFDASELRPTRAEGVAS